MSTHVWPHWLSPAGTGMQAIARAAVAGVRGAGVSGPLVAPAGQSQMQKCLLTSVEAHALPAAGSGQRVPVTGQGALCHPRVLGDGRRGWSRPCPGLARLCSWGAELPVPGECRLRRGHGSCREGRRAAALRRGACLRCVCAGLQAEQVCAAREAGLGCCMAPCPARPRAPRSAWCVCTCAAVCAGSPAPPAEPLPSRGCAPASAAARHGFPGHPRCITETPGKTFLPWGAGTGKGAGSAWRAPSCLAASRHGSAWPGLRRGCPGGGEAICERRRRRG